MFNENDSSNLRQAKVRAAQEQSRYGAGIGALAGSAMTPKNTCDERERVYQDPLRVRVESRLDRISNDAEALLRVKSILDEHPEFEQLIELQKLINRYGL